MTKRWIAVALLAACGGPSSPATSVGTGGTGSTGSTGEPAPGCEGQRAKIEGLYRAEAQARATDNTDMVLADCAKDPSRFAPCLAAATTIQGVEARCLVPLDDEGSEGDAFVR